MSPFEVAQAIQSAGVGVVWLDSRQTVVVLRFVDVGDTAEIRFWCVFPANRQIRRIPRGESETPPSDFRPEGRIKSKITIPMYIQSFLLS